MHTKWFARGWGVMGVVAAGAAALFPAFLVVLGLMAVGCFGMGLVLYLRRPKPASPPRVESSQDKTPYFVEGGDRNVLDLEDIDAPEYAAAKLGNDNQLRIRRWFNRRRGPDKDVDRDPPKPPSRDAP